MKQDRANAASATVFRAAGAARGKLMTVALRASGGPPGPFPAQVVDVSAVSAIGTGPPPVTTAVSSVPWRHMTGRRRSRFWARWGKNCRKTSVLGGVPFWITTPQNGACHSVQRRVIVPQWNKTTQSDTCVLCPSTLVLRRPPSFAVVGQGRRLRSAKDEGLG